MTSSRKDHALVIHEAPQLQILVSAILQNEGFEAHSASRGYEAVEKLKTNRYRVLVVGPQVTAAPELHEYLIDTSRGPELVIVLGDAGSVSFDSQMRAVLSLPLDVEQLVSVLRDRFGSGGERVRPGPSA